LPVLTQAGKDTRAVSVAKLTVAATPSSRFSFFSILAARHPADRQLSAAHRPGSALAGERRHPRFIPSVRMRGTTDRSAENQ
jgi:hypothetical protein